jgi:hypothetical protein
LTLVLRFNQETLAPSLHVPGADHTQRHPTSRPPGHRVPDMCDHLQSSALGLLLLPRSSSLHVVLHLPPAHHKASKRDSPMKQNKTVSDSNSNITKSMTHHNQTKELTTWFLNHLIHMASFQFCYNLNKHILGLDSWLGLRPTLWAIAAIWAPDLDKICGIVTYLYRPGFRVPEFVKFGMITRLHRDMLVDF